MISRNLNIIYANCFQGQKKKRVGDIVKSVNNIAVKSIADLRNTITNLKVASGSKKITVVFLISKKEGNYFIPIELS